MIRTIASVIRGEGLSSAVRRTNERIAGALHSAVLRTRGLFSYVAGTAILNVAASGRAARLGGVQSQLGARLQAERGLRNVALLTPGVLELSSPRHTRRISSDLETGIRDAIAITGARTVHFEGLDGVPLDGVLRLIESGARVIVSVHDFSLFCPRPHLLEEPMGRFCFYSQDLDRCHRCLSQSWDAGRDEQQLRRVLARQLLASANGVIFPSQFLFEQHRTLFSLPELAGQVIEPGLPDAKREIGIPRRGIAYAGSVKRHKGAHLIPEVARILGNTHIHVLGGGDEDLFRAMRHAPNITVHGYYRGGTLPTLLERHRVGLVILPSIVPESYCLVLSEAWLAGAAVVAFDLGAQAERIRRDGGGWLTPLENGAAGLAQIIEQWMAGQLAASTPSAVTSSLDAARAHMDLYRKWGML